MQNFEKLGEFYLGRVVDEESMEVSDQLYLTDSKDLTTHAVVVGMTGSGKTGLSIGLLEEAAMDNIPAVILDPKGDMGNLALAFPKFRTEDFLPWIDPAEANNSGKSPEEYAADVANNWKNGLEKSGITGERLQEYLNKVDISVYTPGSNAGRKLSIIDLADLPSEAVLNDGEALQDYINSTVSSLLSLLKINADPLNSREHILLSTILLNKWRAREDVDLATLIQSIQEPEFDKVGVMPLETIYPRAERFKLAMQFNNLVASPSFSSWLEGEKLDIQNLLYTEEGKPRLSIISINHLSEADRMFFVSIFLNKMVSWVRAQSGTSSLRALLYMDEIYGYFPPVSNPPSKQPLLTLLKQARAYGLGVVLATQNPSDLDYKGLSNIGTWFIGRLQTEQDKARLLDGLQSASGESGAQFDRSELADLIARLPKRTFLVNNVHESGPELFMTRWAMSYLAGPLTRSKIEQLGMNDRSSAMVDVVEIEQANLSDSTFRQAGDGERLATDEPWNLTGAVTSIEKVETIAESASNVQIGNKFDSGTALRPEIHADIPQYYLPANAATNLVYLPSLLAFVETTYTDKLLESSQVKATTWNTPVNNSVIPVDWNKSSGAKPELDTLVNKGSAGAIYYPVPEALNKKTNFTQWEKDLKEIIFRDETLTLMKNEASALISNLGESTRDFQARVQLALREKRDEAVAELKTKYQKESDKLEEKIRKAEARIAREAEQAKQAKFNTFINVGSTILDSFLGKKKFGKSTMNKAASSARAAGRAKQQSVDVSRAEEDLAVLQESLKAIEENLQADIDALTERFDTVQGEITNIQISPSKSNINVKVMSLLWLPFEKANDGSLTPLYTREA